jgi:hypothetical protein
VDYEEQRYIRDNGRPPNYDGAYWTPILSEREAFQVEREQIEEKLGLTAHVSLTDHDSIAAPMRLHMVEKPETVPVSVEWTIPFGPSFFHLGIHNLPRGEARPWMKSFEAYTLRPEPSILCDLLEALHQRPEILIVWSDRFFYSDVSLLYGPAIAPLAPRFLWECLTSRTVSPSPAPASSNPPCGFPAVGFPVRFLPRVM